MTKKELDLVREKLTAHMNSNECDNTMRRVLEILLIGDDELLEFGIDLIRWRTRSPEAFMIAGRQTIKEMRMQ